MFFKQVPANRTCGRIDFVGFTADDHGGLRGLAGWQPFNTRVPNSHAVVKIVTPKSQAVQIASSIPWFVMAKSKRKQQAGFPPGPSPVKPTTPHGGGLNQRPIRWELVLLFLVITFGGTYLAITMRPRNTPPQYTFQILKTYPHDPAAFTQGLLLDGGFLWESTGRKGESSVRKVELETGNVLVKTDLAADLFGEGFALHNDKFYQLTWQNNVALVYNRELEKIQEFQFEGEGWGLASNGTDLIFSNGTSELRFLDPETFAVRRSIIVRRGDFRAGQLNELEFANGNIYANVYQTDLIYEINPESGEVTAEIDLVGLWPMRDRPQDGVLNGIAYDATAKKLLVTGKLCPKIYQIELLKSDRK